VHRLSHSFDDGKTLGADVGRYPFIAEDLHLLLLAGLPAHLGKNSRAFSHEPVSFAFSRHKSAQNRKNREKFWSARWSGPLGADNWASEN
jgi:hypothetical protein